MFGGVHNGSADNASIVKTATRGSSTSISDRSVIIRAALQLLHVTHALNVKYYFFGIVIRVLSITGHACV